MNKDLYIFTSKSCYSLFKLISNKNDGDEFFCFPDTPDWIYADRIVDKLEKFEINSDITIKSK